MKREEPTVLIVEDQEGLAEAYTAVLSTQYETRTATSGEEALEKADEAIDVVILDRRMPGMSGDEVLATLVERGITASVAMLTAVEPDVDIVEMCFDDYVTKPIDNEELLGLVETLLQRTEYDEEVRDFFRLVTKKKALENADREQTTEYDRLVERLRHQRAAVDAKLDEISGEPDSQFDE